MNKILKLGILYGSIIYLGLCFALAQNIRGLYDLNVDIKDAYDPTTFSVYTTLNFDREVVIHSKTNFVFNELPEFFAEYSDDGSGGVHTTSHQIRVFALVVSSVRKNA